MANAFDQQEFNRQTVDVLEQLLIELERQRQGKTLSNLAGIRQTVEKMISSLVREEALSPKKPHPLRYGD